MVVLAGLFAALLAGCSSSPSESVQVVDRNGASAKQKKPQPAGGQYIVQRGDTLYSIAFRFGWDWKALGARNNIPAPYVIKPGQVIRFDSLTPSTPPVRPVATNTVAPKPVASASKPPAYQPVDPAPQAYKQPVIVNNTPVVSSQPSALPAPVVTPVKLSSAGWAWPATGAVISRFSSNGSLNKGIDIAGELGQPVLAAQDGTVVYAGSGLRGYGELVIIKHSDVYVSAYGHNRSLLVREGQKVKAGQVIADMGSTGADRVKLHFEIRRQGKPVDPLQYLPRR
jgi:lipoprotein NlpD